MTSISGNATAVIKRDDGWPLKKPRETPLCRWNFSLAAASCKGIRIPQSGEFFGYGIGNQKKFGSRFGVLGFEILNTAQGIRNPVNSESLIQASLTKNQDSSCWNPKSTAWNPESKTVFIWISLHTRSIFPLLFCSFVIGVYLERLRFIINLFKPLRPLGRPL